MLNRGFEATLGPADTASGHSHAAVIQDTHRDLESLTDSSNHVFGRYLDLIEVNRIGAGSPESKLVFAWPDRNSLSRKFQNKARHLFFFGAIGFDHIHFREESHESRDFAIRDPELVSSDEIVTAIRCQRRFGFNRGCIGATAGLSQAVTRDEFT